MVKPKTRYPEDKKGLKWTAKELSAVTAEWKGDTLKDYGGLYGVVRCAATVSIHWRAQLSLNGKRFWYFCGMYPHKGIAAIRQERDRAKALVSQGIDPRIAKKVEIIKKQDELLEAIRVDELKRNEAKTFEDLYESWIKDGVARSDGNQYLKQSIGKHALPVLGKIELKHLTEHHLRDLYRDVIGKGLIATGLELSKDILQMLRWGEKRKPWRLLLIEGNPAELIEPKLLTPAGYSKDRKRVLSFEEIRKLKTIFETIEDNYKKSKRKYGVERPLKKESQLALWICLGTLCRIGELVKTEWAHVDFDKRTWFKPALNTKGEPDQKRDHLVYLSDFALDKFQLLHTLTGTTKWAFPATYTDGHISEKDITKQVCDRQLQFKSRTKKLVCRVESNSLVLGESEWTPHDLRRTGATMMQDLTTKSGAKVNADVIDLCQNHVVGGKVRRVYQLSERCEEKSEAWALLGNRLEAILSGGADVIALHA